MDLGARIANGWLHTTSTHRIVLGCSLQLTPEIATAIIIVILMDVIISLFHESEEGSTFELLLN